MSKSKKILLGIAGVYIVGAIAIVAIFGFTRRDNESFKPQEEFRLESWSDLPGPIDITKAVMYLLIAAILTLATMIYVARKMEARPNRVQTAVEAAYDLARNNIAFWNMDPAMAAKW